MNTGQYMSRSNGKRLLKRRRSLAGGTHRMMVLCSALVVSLAFPSAALAYDGAVLSEGSGGSPGSLGDHGDSFVPEPIDDGSDSESEPPKAPPSGPEAQVAGLSDEVLDLIRGSSELPSTFVENIESAGGDPAQSFLRYNDDVAVPADGTGSFRISLGESNVVGLRLEGAAGRAKVLGNWGISYGGDVPSIVTFPQGAILETFTIVESDQSPRRYSMELDLPESYRLVLADNSGAAVVDGEGLPSIFIDAPLAVDANGSTVDLALQVDGDQLVLDVNHQNDEYTYPIVADPVWYYFGLGYKVNHAEFEYCKYPSRYRICFIAFSESRSALSLAQRYFSGRRLHNGPGDAFRHCYWSAAMAIRISHSKAREFGDMHETTPGQPTIEKTMDQRNNGIGRSVGTRVRIFHGGVLYRAEVDCLNKADGGDLWVIDSSGRLRLGT